MATDSSSGTLPSSRRLTIDSSSSIARSKGIFLTSALFSAISLSGASFVVQCNEDSADSLSALVARAKFEKPLQHKDRGRVHPRPLCCACTSDLQAFSSVLKDCRQLHATHAQHSPRLLRARRRVPECGGVRWHRNELCVTTLQFTVTALLIIS